MIVSSEERSFRDVVIYRDDPVFSHKTKTFATLAVDAVPGTLLTSTGEAYASGSDLLIALDSHKAGSNVPVIVVDRGCVLNRAGLIGTDATALANAIAQIEASGLNRVSE
ncbi:hypothetical protein CQ982_000347 [Escherichia coli]|nr:hypothetical protein [Escherichia coli]EFE0755868.1 hypothetical protein [Escherichia coli]EFI6567714.1 hypothetical protein [Escherichia coli]